MRAARRLGFALASLLALGAATWVAGEQTEVAVLRTTDAQRDTHDTRLWVVDLDGTAWVRAGRPEQRWFQRLREQPAVTLVRHGVSLPFRAVVIEDPVMRARIDAAFREKYGLVDWWYGLLLRRDPRPIRLDPASAGPREAMGP